MNSIPREIIDNWAGNTSGALGSSTGSPQNIDDSNGGVMIMNLTNNIKHSRKR